MLMVKVLLVAFSYTGLTALLFGGPSQPIALATTWSDRLGVPFWQPLAALCVVASASVFVKPIKYLFDPILRPMVFTVLAVALPTVVVGSYVDAARMRAILAFDADEIKGRSFFVSIRNAPADFQFFLHTAALKDCVPYAWSYRTMSFYVLPPNVAVNVLPQSWLDRCSIVRDREQ